MELVNLFIDNFELLSEPEQIFGFMFKQYILQNNTSGITIYHPTAFLQHNVSGITIYHLTDFLQKVETKKSGYAIGNINHLFLHQSTNLFESFFDFNSENQPEYVFSSIIAILKIVYVLDYNKIVKTLEYIVEFIYCRFEYSRSEKFLNPFCQEFKNLFIEMRDFIATHKHDDGPFLRGKCNFKSVKGYQYIFKLIINEFKSEEDIKLLFVLYPDIIYNNCLEKTPIMLKLANVVSEKDLQKMVDQCDTASNLIELLNNSQSFGLTITNVTIDIENTKFIANVPNFVFLVNNIGKFKFDIIHLVERGINLLLVEKGEYSDSTCEAFRILFSLDQADHVLKDFPRWKNLFYHIMCGKCQEEIFDIFSKYLLNSDNMCGIVLEDYASNTHDMARYWDTTKLSITRIMRILKDTIIKPERYWKTLRLIKSSINVAKTSIAVKIINSLSYRSLIYLVSSGWNINKNIIQSCNTHFLNNLLDSEFYNKLHLLIYAFAIVCPLERSYEINNYNLYDLKNYNPIFDDCINHRSIYSTFVSYVNTIKPYPKPLGCIPDSLITIQTRLKDLFYAPPAPDSDVSTWRCGYMIAAYSNQHKFSNKTIDVLYQESKNTSLFLLYDIHSLEQFDFALNNYG